ncbi:MAG: DUF5320 domain-containing protein [Candidatus Brocadiia bacterium]
MGPMTGRAAGYCAGYGVPGYMNPVPGRGAWGRGFRGGGRGWRNWYYATGMPGWARASSGLPAWGAGGGYAPQAPAWGAPAPEQEAQFLRQQADVLQQQLEDIRTRLDELESEAD